MIWSFSFEFWCLYIRYYLVFVDSLLYCFTVLFTVLFAVFNCINCILHCIHCIIPTTPQLAASLLTYSQPASHPTPARPPNRQIKYFLPDPVANDVKYQASVQPFLVLGLLTTGLAIGHHNAALDVLVQ